MFNAKRPGGLNCWTKDLEQYEQMGAHILDMLEEAGEDGTVLLSELFATGQGNSARTRLSQKADSATTARNYTKVDLKARGLVDRVR